jgi:HAD superfamily hydrolase (TIGR01509 family)
VSESRAVKKPSEAELWDNDGVLMDTERLFFEATRTAFARLGIELTEKVWGTLYLGEGKKSHEIGALLGANSAKLDAALAERTEQFLKLLRHSPPIRPKVRETLSALSGRVKMGIATGCRREQLELMHASTGLLGFFETIVTGCQCANRKPHPEIYLTAMKSLGVKPENCVAVEDSGRGFAAALAARIPCIVVPTELTRHLDFKGALAIEPDVSAVLRYIRE